ncbi:MFS transporter [Pandoraea sp. PE-S2R-1]|uniref:MFS transporter n=1 Tax=Pandoraea sp. PE-S2R-1 TaxID=1986994 RepID=UPI00113007AC|nr:MFS transporter [Pandoraea sp. PE-S2R-1]
MSDARSSIPPDRDAWTAFVFYQFSDLCFSASIRICAMSFAWIMIERYHDDNFLGNALTLAWSLQLVGMYVAGKLGDCFPKQRIAMTAVMTGCVATLVFALMGASGSPYWLAGMFCLISAAGGVCQPIHVSITPELCPTGKTAEAFAHRGKVSSANLILGPALSGGLISLAGIAATTVFSFSAALMACFFLGGTQRCSRYPSPAVRRSGGTPSGTALLLRLPTERALALLSAAFNFVIVPWLTLLLPVLILQRLSLGALALGCAEGAFGVGMMLASGRVLSTANYRFGRAMTTVIGGVAMATMLIWASCTQSLLWICVGALLGGAGLILFNVNTMTVRCMATPPEYRSRLEACFLMVCAASIPFGTACFTRAMVSAEVSDIIGYAGFGLLACSIALMLVPNFRYLMALDDNSLEGAYLRRYPEAFRAREQRGQ